MWISCTAHISSRWTIVQVYARTGACTLGWAIGCFASSVYINVRSDGKRDHIKYMWLCFEIFGSMVSIVLAPWTVYARHIGTEACLRAWAKLLCWDTIYFRVQKPCCQRLLNLSARTLQCKHPPGLHNYQWYHLTKDIALPKCVMLHLPI